MRLIEDLIELSATDLSNFLGCRHRTGLDLAVALGEAAPDRHDPLAAALAVRGEEHERRYVDALRSQGLDVRDLRSAHDRPARTIDAMREGAEVILQADLRGRGWQGHPDVLRRIASPSALGGWSYEVYDTKLAGETRGGTILQLSVYSELVAQYQGVTPERFHVVTTDVETPIQTYRVADYAAYYRLVKQQLVDAVARGVGVICATHYPEPVEHCELCRWWQRCDDRRRQDDHLSLVAGITRVHRAELVTHGFATLAAVAAMPDPLPFRPARGATPTYVRVQHQARLQVEQRTRREPVFELLLPPAAEQGLVRLPQPSPGDLFLDLEGDPFARDGGREYLFGVSSASGYLAWWAFDDGEERAAFEAVVDLVELALGRDPGMHVYHFGHYEPSAFKRLMGRYASRAGAIDRLLRSGRFVDLHAIVKGALRAGVESYSIKKLEPFYRFAREVSLDRAAAHLRTVELAIEARAAAAIPEDVRQAIEGYNRDDCRSTEGLRDWLEELRARIEAGGTIVPRPIAQPPDPPARVSELEAQVDDLRARLLDGVPDDRLRRSPEQQTRWLLAYLLDWHRREDKVAWWEYFRLRDLPEEELHEEPQAIAGLEFVARVRDVIGAKTGRPTGLVIDRYTYPVQEMEVRDGDNLKLKDERAFGEVENVDLQRRLIEIEKGRKVAHVHPSAVFVHNYFSTDMMQKALLALGEAVASGAGAGVCGLDLLFRRPPRLTSGPFRRRAGEDVLDFAVRCGLELDASTLAIQGPPGSGKTYTGARMICALVAAGRRVGVTAVSHKVIRNLLDSVRAEAPEIRLAHKTRARDEGRTDLLVTDENKEALEWLASGAAQVLGGTPWLWAREEAAGAVDVLFVDEAGQMSLANVLAASQAARSLVLLGDPQQLEQPQKGSHPDGVDVSALEHVSGADTMPDDRGIFLPVTWRLAPAICRFTSEVFYEGRLDPLRGLEHQRLAGTGVFDEPGLYFAPVAHDRNHNFSREEVDVVHAIVTRLLSGATWIDRHRVTRPLTAADILVVAPYNAQVTRLQERLAGVTAAGSQMSLFADVGRDNVRVGTVDKFQGQEAPVAIYSMATSRPEDAPRGMEFLFSLNRLNVATSRARAAAILVASPYLFEPECRTARQMRLANALCRFRELAHVVSP